MQIKLVVVVVVVVVVIPATVNPALTESKLELTSIV